MIKKKILIIAAHPDDEILGCGGTVAGLIEQEGFIGKSVILGKGLTARGKIPDEEIDLHLKAAKKANQTLGINNINFHDFPDNEFDSVPLLEIVKVVETEITQFQPTIIFTHFGNDLNIDHQKTFEAVVTACRPQPGFLNPKIYSFFIPSSTDWITGIKHPVFNPNTFFNIEKTINVKIDALKHYKHEMRPYPHSRSYEAVINFSKYWGNRVGYQFIEPFQLVRNIISMNSP